MEEYKKTACACKMHRTGKYYKSSARFQLCPHFVRFDIIFHCVKSTSVKFGCIANTEKCGSLRQCCSPALFARLQSWVKSQVTFLCLEVQRVFSIHKAELNAQFLLRCEGTLKLVIWGERPNLCRGKAVDLSDKHWNEFLLALGQVFKDNFPKWQGKLTTGEKVHATHNRTSMIVLIQPSSETESRQFFNINFGSTRQISRGWIQRNLIKCMQTIFETASKGVDNLKPKDKAAWFCFQGKSLSQYYALQWHTKIHCWTQTFNQYPKTSQIGILWRQLVVKCRVLKGDNCKTQNIIRQNEIQAAPLSWKIHTKYFPCTTDNLVAVNEIIGKRCECFVQTFKAQEQAKVHKTTRDTQCLLVFNVAVEIANRSTH